MDRQLTFGSLFAGIGGFDLGFERAGLVCKWQVEIDGYATKILERHWPNVHRERDIVQCGKHNLKQVDVICGGFPCQDISYAGRGAGLDGKRSGLFFEAIRVVCELQPKFVVLENVAALLTRGLDRVLGTLAEVGYDAEWHCIPAAAVGAPHIRDRVFILAYGKEHRRNKRQSIARGCKKRIATQEESRSWNGSSIDVADTNSTRLEKRQGENTSRTRAIFGAKPSRSEWWAIEPELGRVANGIPCRVDRLRGLGNAVVPQLAEWIAGQIIEISGGNLNS